MVSEAHPGSHVDGQRCLLCTAGRADRCRAGQGEEAAQELGRPSGLGQPGVSQVGMGARLPGLGGKGWGKAWGTQSWAAGCLWTSVLDVKITSES